MQIWIPEASSHAVLTFTDPATKNDLEAVGWDLAEEARGKRNPDWYPVTAYLGRGKPRHFVYMGPYLTCTEEAWQKLSTHIAMNSVEPLELNVNGSKFFILNVLDTVDCVDLGMSKVMRSPLDGSIEILAPAFRTSQLTNTMLFRTPNTRNQVYCTDAFKVLVEQHKLKDIEFQQPVSPLVNLARLIR